MNLTIGKPKEEHWEIDEKSIRIYSKSQIIFGKPKLENEINLDDIVSIEIFFTSQPIGGAAGRVGMFSYIHPIIFNIKLKNDEQISYNILTGTNRDILIQAIEYLINYNILIEDKYDLISLIRNKDKKIWDGIEEIIKSNHLPYSRHKV